MIFFDMTKFFNIFLCDFVKSGPQNTPDSNKNNNYFFFYYLKFQKKKDSDCYPFLLIL